ncbi:hypothetical protein F-VV10_0445 [Faustovirus]|nr:hypothetical protein F-VV10_0445 [Faustovirus]
MADNNVTPFPANDTVLLLRILDKVHAIEASINHEPILMIPANEEQNDKWLDKKNRPKPRFKLADPKNPRVRFRLACRECIDFFEQYYDSKIGAKYTKYDEKTYLLLIEDLYDHIKNNTNEYVYNNLLETLEEMFK